MTCTVVINFKVKKLKYQLPQTGLKKQEVLLRYLLTLVYIMQKCHGKGPSFSY